MKTLRFRIIMTWLCFILIGVSVLFGFAHSLLTMPCCLANSIARSRFVKPAFPRAPRWFERLIYMAVLPMIFFMIVGFCFGFGEPWAQIFRIVLWVCLPPLLLFAASEDIKIWRSERTNAVA